MIPIPSSRLPGRGLTKILLFGIALALATHAIAAPPDLTAGGVPDNTRSTNLGPTGMRGWVYHVNSGGRRADSGESRQILVHSVAGGSPAAGILAPDDVILGASGTGANPVNFTYDARKALADAINAAESNNPATLRLLRWRSGTAAPRGRRSWRTEFPHSFHKSAWSYDRATRRHEVSFAILPNCLPQAGSPRPAPPLKTTMKPLRKSAWTFATAILATSAQAAVINLDDFSFKPDGTTAAPFQNTNVNTPNGGSVLPASASGTPVVYVISTFTFGTGSGAHLQWQFYVNETSAPRIGLEVNDQGLVSTISTGAGNLNFTDPATPNRTTVNLNQDMAGQTITLLAKLQYDAAFSATYQAPGTSDDTLMNVWINPDGNDVEGSGLSAGDMYALWNSAGFNWFRQTIQNQSTPGTAGDSSITNTTILTGTDATFANAMAVAIPEPSSVLLGGLGLLALLRRRRA